jgi:hypothetical protein
MMLATSWEPLAVTDGTAITLPGEGPHVGKGVIERMATIGQHITRAEEIVTARPVLANEANRLQIALKATVLDVTRTYATDERPVETADIVIPADKWALAYQIPSADEAMVRRHVGQGDLAYESSFVSRLRSLTLAKIASCATSGMRSQIAVAATHRSASCSLWPNPCPVLTHQARSAA